MTDTTSDRPGVIDARPVRHPGRWVALAVILVLVGMLVSSFLTNPRWNFTKALEIMQQTPVIEGLWKGTIIGTVGSMAIGIVGGIIIAVLRLSDNPILRGVSFVYTWFFRGIPRLVLLAMIGSGVGVLYNKLDFGVPFGQQLASFMGLSSDFTFFTLNVNQFSSTLLAGIIGLGVSEAAYMAEIARAGILSVDRGQAMRRIVLPQAMRVIVPPTGNETIAMVKDTSLLSAIPVITELYYQTSAIGNRTLLIMPAFVAVTAWYLIVGSVLMVGQYFLEKRFGRGFGTGAPNKRFARPAGAGGA